MARWSHITVLVAALGITVASFDMEVSHRGDAKVMRMETRRQPMVRYPMVAASPPVSASSRYPMVASAPVVATLPSYGYNYAPAASSPLQDGGIKLRSPTYPFGELFMSAARGRRAAWATMACFIPFVAATGTL
eukprot:CAMPEP_0171076988 /NCGR_PEP_ID=MMETSP0766_2-20121228/13757_1 /TAXON_ID=439317 /ORGANISM="Gambierdiscus australes, Strain CAWD 149" /LENGTH=133 /DNA_ID=CAMNT_0011534011 /DNA_START=130 /DNA_END=531 /DNA_ORIENTATION=+